MKKSILILAGIIVLSAGVYARWDRPEPVVTEETVTVKRGDIAVQIAETGSLEPIRLVEIKSEQSGEVKLLQVSVGDRVKKGEPLAVIQPESNQAKRVAEARAMIDQEALSVEGARLASVRAVDLYKQGFIPRIEMENAERQYQSALLKHQLAKRQLLLTLGGNMALYEKYLNRNMSLQEMDDLTIYSPIEGTVLEMKVSQGEMVTSGTSTVTGGTALMWIADISTMWVKTKINEVNIRQIQEGQGVEVRLDAIPGQLYQGRVVKISPKGEKNNNVVTYDVTISILNSDRRLMPAMTANVDILTDFSRQALYLPITAIVEENGKDAVWVKSAANGKQLKKIEVGIKNETSIVVTQGLNEGAMVILPTRVKAD